MVDDGVFSLGSGERAEFLDKFRVGSYLQIQQINVDPRVFDTVWSILEGREKKDIDENYLLPARNDIQTCGKYRNDSESDRCSAGIPEKCASI